MTPEKVMECLKSYRIALGRSGHLQVEIERLTKELNLARSKAIECMTFGQKSEPGMPHGYGVSDPTPHIAGSIVLDEDVRSLERALVQAKAEHEIQSQTLRYVDGWLRSLTKREQFVIKRQVIDAATWREVGVEHRELYGESVSKDTLKRMKNRALGKIFDLTKQR